LIVHVSLQLAFFSADLHIQSAVGFNLIVFEHR
jgi:hypothetical protein